MGKKEKMSNKFIYTIENKKGERSTGTTKVEFSIRGGKHWSTFGDLKRHLYQFMAGVSVGGYTNKTDKFPKEYEDAEIVEYELVERKRNPVRLIYDEEVKPEKELDDSYTQYLIDHGIDPNEKMEPLMPIGRADEKKTKD